MDTRKAATSTLSTHENSNASNNSSQSSHQKSIADGILVDPKYPISSMKFSPDGQLIAVVCTHTSHIQIRRVSDGALLSTLQSSHGSKGSLSILDICFFDSVLFCILIKIEANIGPKKEEVEFIDKSEYFVEVFNLSNDLRFINNIEW